MTAITEKIANEMDEIKEWFDGLADETSANKKNQMGMVNILPLLKESYLYMRELMRKNEREKFSPDDIFNLEKTAETLIKSINIVNKHFFIVQNPKVVAGYEEFKGTEQFIIKLIWLLANNSIKGNSPKERYDFIYSCIREGIKVEDLLAFEVDDYNARESLKYEKFCDNIIKREINIIAALRSLVKLDSYESCRRALIDDFNRYTYYAKERVYHKTLEDFCIDNKHIASYAEYTIGQKSKAAKSILNFKL
jgi:hypothetical protein